MIYKMALARGSAIFLLICDCQQLEEGHSITKAQEEIEILKKAKYATMINLDNINWLCADEKLPLFTKNSMDERKVCSL